MIHTYSEQVRNWRLLKLLSLLAFLFFPFLSYSGDRNGEIPLQGLPFTINYNSSDYNAGPANYCILEDDRGVVYFGNSSGLLEYDGTGWRLIKLPNKGSVYALAQDHKSRIYVGGDGEIGYLQTLSSGNLKYISLTDSLPNDIKLSGSVHTVLIREEKVFFFSHRSLLVYDGTAFTQFFPSVSFDKAFQSATELYVIDHEEGILKWVGNGFQWIKGSQVLRKETVAEVLSLDSDTQLLITQRNTCWQLQGNSLIRYHLPALANWSFGKITTALQLSDGHILLGTLNHGIIWLSERQQLLNRIHKANGLENDWVTQLKLDSHGNIWATLGNGLSYIETSAPFSILGEENGLQGTSYAAALHQGHLYVGTTKGVYFYDWDTKNEKVVFTQIKNTNIRSWHLESIGNTLFCGHEDGLIQIQDNKTASLLEGLPVWTTAYLSDSPDVLFAGTEKGVFFSRKKGSWQKPQKLEGWDDQVRFMIATEGSHGKELWVTEPGKGIVRLSLNAEMDSVNLVTHFTIEHGLPSSYRNRVFRVFGELLIGTESGIYRYHAAQNRFYNDTLFNPLLGENVYVKWLEEGFSEDIWFQVGESKATTQEPISGIGVFRKNQGGGYKVVQMPFYKLKDTGVEDITPINLHHIVFETNEGLIHYDATQAKNYQKDFNSLLRKVEITKGGRKPFFDGLLSGENTNQNSILEYKNNSLRFVVGGTFYESAEAVQYAYKLKGYDQDWSAWTTVNHKEYTNLNEGDYVFMVKARNIYEVESNTTAFRFSVSPPFFRTLPGYLIMALLLGLIIFGTVRVSNLYQIRKTRALEKIIQERTSEIQEQRQKIQEQNTVLITRNKEVNNAKFELHKANEELKAINENLEEIVQDRTSLLRKANKELDLFVYRASHDLKGPLMRLLGLVQLGTLESKEPTSLDYFQRLEKMVSEMDTTLDKLLAVNVINHSDEVRNKIDFEEVKDYIRRYFNQHFKNITTVDVTFSLPEECNLYSNPELINIIVENLVENAVLYHDPSKGSSKVEVSVKQEADHLYLKVHDNGHGIEEKHLPHIYEMFYRGIEISQGNGLGLYVVKKALDKLGGSIHCESKPQEFTTFEVHFPLNHQG